MTDHHDAWNPGLTSEIPARLMPEVTLYRPENSTVSYAEAREAADFCGLKPQEMVAFTVRRLVVHEVLIRVTADFYVPDGPAYEELGLNLRAMAARIIDGHILPRINEVEAHFRALRLDAEKAIDTILARDIFERHKATPVAPAPQGLIARLLRRPAPATPPLPQLPEIAALADWGHAAQVDADDLETACRAALQPPAPARRRSS